jgi:pimeloyl-ACP methyl ester carboxylesterase
MLSIALLMIGVAADTTYSTLVPVAAAESLQVTVMGDGPAVVFIPGLFGSAYSYRHVMMQLDSAGYRSIVVEPLGMGSSSRPADADYSLTAQADRVAAAMRTLGVDRGVLVAHAVGASIAMRIAYRHPEMVRGVVSIEGGPGETGMTPGFRRWMKLVPVAKMIDGRRMMAGMIYREMKSLSADDSWVTQSVVQAYTRGMAQDYRGTLTAYQGMARAEEPEALRDNLKAIGCPLVLLVGDTGHDQGPSEEEVALLAERVPSFAVDTVAASGFFIQEEQPLAVANAVDGLATGPACEQ